jgi:hypothetical protein
MVDRDKIVLLSRNARNKDQLTGSLLRSWRVIALVLRKEQWGTAVVPFVEKARKEGSPWQNLKRDQGQWQNRPWGVTLLCPKKMAGSEPRFVVVLNEGQPPKVVGRVQKTSLRTLWEGNRVFGVLQRASIHAVIVSYSNPSSLQGLVASDCSLDDHLECDLEDCRDVFSWLKDA